MADETKLRKQAERGARAREILENELVVEAFESMQTQLFKEWCETTATEAEKREYLFRMHLAHIDFKGQLERTLNTGNAAISQLKEKGLLGRLTGG